MPPKARSPFDPEVSPRGILRDSGSQQGEIGVSPSVERKFVDGPFVNQRRESAGLAFDQRRLARNRDRFFGSGDRQFEHQFGRAAHIHMQSRAWSAATFPAIRRAPSSLPAEAVRRRSGQSRRWSWSSGSWWRHSPAQRWRRQSAPRRSPPRFRGSLRWKCPGPELQWRTTTKQKDRRKPTSARHRLAPTAESNRGRVQTGEGDLLGISRGSCAVCDGQTIFESCPASGIGRWRLDGRGRPSSIRGAAAGMAVDTSQGTHGLGGKSHRLELLNKLNYLIIILI